jgi:hypothetical protein
MPTRGDGHDDNGFSSASAIARTVTGSRAGSIDPSQAMPISDGRAAIPRNVVRTSSNLSDWPGGTAPTTA